MPSSFLGAVLSQHQIYIGNPQPVLELCMFVVESFAKPTDPGKDWWPCEHPSSSGEWSVSSGKIGREDVAAVIIDYMCILKIALSIRGSKPRRLNQAFCKVHIFVGLVLVH